MDQQQVIAVDLLYEAARELAHLAQVQLDLADRMFTVASALHDSVHTPDLRSVS